MNPQEKNHEGKEFIVKSGKSHFPDVGARTGGWIRCAGRCALIRTDSGETVSVSPPLASPLAEEADDSEAHRL